MKTEKGNNRVVIIFRGIAIKIPRIRAKDAIYRSCRRIERGNFVYTLKMRHENELSIWWLLLKGVIDNWKEFRFYRKTKLNILVPTYFSFFGLLNIQKAGKPPGEVNYLKFWKQITDITNQEAYRDAHTFSNPNNFCRVNDRLRMFDYGSRAVREVLSKYGEKIYNDFDFALCKKE